MVHTNKSITDIEKFCYLRNALEGEASSLIKNLETSSTNYEIAWKIITTRYNNTRMLIQTHTKRIFDLEPINKESAIKLKNLTDSLNAHIQALKALKHDPYNWGALLLHVIYTKLDTNSIRQWEVEVLRDDLPSVQSMMEFLGKRCQMLESVENAKLLIFKQNDSNYSSTKTSKFGTSKKGASTFLTTYKMKCYLCQQPHPIYKCTVFLALDIPSRISKINELKLCSNCLKRSDHQVKQCPARKCGKCQKLHNSLLHQEKEGNSDEGNIQGNGSNDTVVVAHTVDTADTDNQVLLATEKIKISSSAGRSVHGRALLDNGSQSNFITNNLVHKLGLKRHKVNIPICGISESKNNIKYKVTAIVQSLNSSYITTVEFLVLSKITGSLPHTPIRAISIPDNVNVADPSFNCPNNVDVLIGGDTYWDIMCNEKLKTKDGPYLQKTLFGWVVVGKTSTELSTTKLNSCLLTTQNQYQLLDNKIELFWKMEELSSKHNFTDEEKSCLTHFNENLAQNEDGRFIVKLPFKENCHQLGNSYTSALRRFLSLEKRFIKNPELYIKYKMFMSEYENLNHMQRVYDTGGDKQLIDSSKYFYLPHSCVINDRSRTTKLRVVFDGSAKTSSGVSLNDTLMNGPKIQPDLLDTVVRFRTHKYAFSADITKMYRQVLIHEDHRDYQRVLWRSDPNDEVKVYRLCTVTYGLAPAGFLAISCISRLGDKTINTKLKEIIKNDFCVDDCLTGADSLLEAIKLRNEFRLCEVGDLNYRNGQRIIQIYFRIIIKMK